MAKKIILTPVPEPARTIDDVLQDIREIYFRTNKSTIARDFDRAIDLLKTMPTAEDRQRAAVFMDGLAEMRREFGVIPSKGTSSRRGGQARRRSGR